MATDSCICEVWSHNLQAEMTRIAELAEVYDYVAVDTEFPGVVARPISGARTRDFHYQTLRCNVDLLKIIQLGITLADSEGRTPKGVCTWQFNFSFDLACDMYAQDSIDLLRTHGLDFDAHRNDGVDVMHFAELLITSGLVLIPNVTWLSFHGGYDFGYLLKVLTTLPLPAEERKFFELLRLYFPRFYDLKCLTRAGDKYHGGLNKIADQLSISRVGTSHQAGSDSLLTLHIFFKIVKDEFSGELSDDLLGGLYGLGAIPYYPTL